MPVFSRVRDGVLSLTADGDFTVNELRRVSVRALEAEGTPARVPVLLDLSGAAGLGNKPPTERAAAGAIFGAYRDRVTRVAVVAPAAFSASFDDQGDFAREAGVPVKACPSHADARQWLMEAS